MIRSHAIGNRPRGKVGVAAAHQAHIAIDPAIRIRRRGGHHARLKGEIGPEPGQSQRRAEEFGIGCGNEEMAGVELKECLARCQFRRLNTPCRRARHGRFRDRALDLARHRKRIAAEERRLRRLRLAAARTDKRQDQR